MPTLNWTGKDAVVKHHHEVPFHLLKDVPGLACGDPGSGNFWQHRTELGARVPRTRCGELGVLVAEVPWARAGIRYLSW